MRFCRHILDLWTISEDFVSLLIQKQTKEDETSSVAPTIFDLLNVNLSSFYPFYVCCTVFTFQTELMMKKRETREKGFLNL